MPRRRAKKTNQTGRTIIILLGLLGVWALITYWDRVPEPISDAVETPLAQLKTQVPIIPTTANQPTTATGGNASGNGAWQVFFTTPRYPDKGTSHTGGIDTQLVALIDSAQKTLDMAIYDFDLENVARAMAAAAKRGVKVRMVTDTDTLTNKDEKVQAAFAIVKGAKIPIVDDKRGPIMHNKFAVVDGKTVLTGSWNFTDGDTYRLNNNAIRIASPELAQNYTTEFEKMFVKRIFGPTKPVGVPYPKLTINGVKFENYFASEDDVAEHVVERLQQARQTIDFMAFSFTSDPIGQAVIGRAKAGVTVRGVFETTGSQTQYSEYTAMKKAGLEVYTDGNPYVMHHKVFIIDSKTVIFGSFNFTDNADKQNDENLLIVDDAGLAQQFEQEFLRVREVAQNPPAKN